MVRQNWQMFVAGINHDLCDSIVQNFLKLPEQQAKTYNDDPSYRKSKVRWVNGEINLKNHLMQYVNEANARAFHVEIAQCITELQFTEYDSKYQGEYKLHHDIDWQADTFHDRKLSIIVQLSDPNLYQGGDFEFAEVQNPESKDLRAKGTVLVFPSYLHHLVRPVTSGMRYSLVSWVWGPRWK